MRRMRSITLAGVAALVLTLPLAAQANATAPGNDNLASATIVEGLPFDDYPDMSQATTEDGEGLPCDNYSGLDETVWYAWTPEQAGIMHLEVDGPWGGQTVAVYGPYDTQPTDFGTLGGATWCVYDPGVDYALHESVDAGKVYMLQLAAASAWSDSRRIAITESVRPGNDDLADAMAVESLPFEDWADLTAATQQPGEDLCMTYADRTVWYSYTPDEDGSIIVTLSRESGDVYGRLYKPGDDTYIQPMATGGSECFSNQWGPGFVPVVAGETYLIQVGETSWSPGSEPVHVLIKDGPPPLSVTVDVNPLGSVSKVGGYATVAVTVTCNQPADLWLYANLRERLTRTKLANGSSDTGGQCGTEPTTFQFRFADDDVAFAPGSASLGGGFDVNNGWTYAGGSYEGTVKLRPSH